jgi:predicted transcriptional regulator
MILDELFKTLSNETRRNILKVLADGPMTPTDIVNALGVPQNTVAQHLKVLKLAKMVQSPDWGKRRPYTISTQKYVEMITLGEKALDSTK